MPLKVYLPSNNDNSVKRTETKAQVIINNVAQGAKKIVPGFLMSKAARENRKILKDNLALYNLDGSYDQLGKFLPYTESGYNTKDYFLLCDTFIADKDKSSFKEFLDKISQEEKKKSINSVKRNDLNFGTTK